VALRQARKEYWALPAEEDLVHSGPDWLLLILNQYSAEVIANFMMLIWRVWSVRNNTLKGGQKISIEGSVIFLTRYIDSLLHSRQGALFSESKGKSCALVGGRSSRPVKIRPMRESWLPPTPGAFKINVDGAYIFLTLVRQRWV
jgi:hypothetical protein